MATFKQTKVVEATPSVRKPVEQTQETPEQEHDRLIREGFQRWADSFRDDAKTISTSRDLTLRFLAAIVACVVVGGMVAANDVGDRGAVVLALAVGGLIWFLLGPSE